MLTTCTEKFIVITYKPCTTADAISPLFVSGSAHKQHNTVRYYHNVRGRDVVVENWLIKYERPIQICVSAQNSHTVHTSYPAYQKYYYFVNYAFNHYHVGAHNN